MGLTLALVYIVDRFNHGTAALVCGIVGATILVVILLMKQESQPAPIVPASPVITQTSNPTNTATQNQTVNVNIGGEPQKKPPTWQQKKAWLEATDGGRKIPGHLPNLRAQRLELDVPLYLGILDRWMTDPGDEHIHEANKGLAIVLPIHNEPKPGESIGIATGVRARLVWKADGKDLCTAFPVAWVNTEYNTVKIEAEAARLIVAIELPKERWLAVTNERNYQSNARKAMRLDPVPKQDCIMELMLFLLKSGAVEALPIVKHDWKWKDHGPEITPISD